MTRAIGLPCVAPVLAPVDPPIHPAAIAIAFAFASTISLPRVAAILALVCAAILALVCAAILALVCAATVAIALAFACTVGLTRFASVLTGIGLTSRPIGLLSGSVLPRIVLAGLLLTAALSLADCFALRGEACIATLHRAAAELVAAVLNLALRLSPRRLAAGSSIAAFHLTLLGSNLRLALGRQFALALRPIGLTRFTDLLPRRAAFVAGLAAVLRHPNHCRCRSFRRLGSLGDRREQHPYG
ncbi:hypothetical protein A9995_11310 [Erythrobacter sp. QSSC1-22B]|nr:hypothetical protein A9995_11310 [Erythrobacter sp. QSSC1-22B]